MGGVALVHCHLWGLGFDSWTPHHMWIEFVISAPPLIKVFCFCFVQVTLVKMTNFAAITVSASKCISVVMVIAHAWIIQTRKTAHVAHQTTNARMEDAYTQTSYAMEWRIVTMAPMKETVVSLYWGIFPCFWLLPDNETSKRRSVETSSFYKLRSEANQIWLILWILIFINETSYSFG